MVEYFGEKLGGFVFTEKGLGSILWFTLCETTNYLRRCAFHRTNDSEESVYAQS